MSITAYQINNGMPTPISDRHIYNLLARRQCGIISGMALSKNGTRITVGDGWGIINGCIFRVRQQELESPVATSSLEQGRLLVRLNTIAPSIEFAFQHASTLPVLVQETGDDFTYEMELCRYEVSTVTITSDLNVSARHYVDLVPSGVFLTGNSSNITMSMELSQDNKTLNITYS